LSTFWGITAGHCIDGLETTPRIFSIRMGSTMRNAGGKVIPVGKIYKHPSYNPDSLNYDVALLKTQPHRMTGTWIQPIPLPESGEIIKNRFSATVSGWGYMNAEDPILSNVLKYTTVVTVDQDQCNDDMKWHGGITDA